MEVLDWFLLARARDIPLPLDLPDGLQLNIGAGKRDILDTVPLDRERGWVWPRDPIPYEDETVSGIWAHAFVDYLDDPIAIFREFWRVLKWGGVVNLVMPHGNSDLWNEDVLRRTRYTEETWRNLFNSPWYSPADEEGPAPPFTVHTCFIMGVVWRNLTLFTQLVKMP